MLEISALSKRFDGAAALDGIDFSVAPGEIVAVLGTSGSGKSTLLRLVGGLEPVSAGEVRLEGRVVTGPSPKLGFVFQEPRLMPWLKVRDNVAFGLGGLPRGQQRARAEIALDRVGLAHAADSWPRQLSGGMAQRVAIARALVTRPEVLLLDEPFSALDALTRLELQTLVLQLWERRKFTAILVTHDVEEAIFLADRVAVLSARPTSLSEVIHVGLPRPRDQFATREDPRFLKLRHHITASLLTRNDGHVASA